jgi:hypothetical protein
MLSILHGNRQADGAGEAFHRERLTEKGKNRESLCREAGAAWG